MLTTVGLRTSVILLQNRTHALITTQHKDFENITLIILTYIMVFLFPVFK